MFGSTRRLDGYISGLTSQETRPRLRSLIPQNGGAENLTYPSYASISEVAYQNRCLS